MWSIHLYRKIIACVLPACLLCYILLFINVQNLHSTSNTTYLDHIANLKVQRRNVILEDVRKLFKESLQQSSSNKQFHPKAHGNDKTNNKSVNDPKVDEQFIIHENSLKEQQTPSLQADSNINIKPKKNVVSNKADFVKVKQRIDTFGVEQENAFIKTLSNMRNNSDLDFKLKLTDKFRNTNLASWQKHKQANSPVGQVQSSFLHKMPLINESNTESYRKDICGACFKNNFNFIISNNHICDNRVVGTNGDKVITIDLVILVTTAYEHAHYRNTLRNTWLTHAQSNSVNSNVRYVFILGDTNDLKQKNAVIHENEVYRDIIMADFYDTYRNLTYKTITAMRWATTKCAHAQFVMKTDDDMWVNIPNLLKVISKNRYKIRNSLVGYCYNAEPDRNTDSKWFVPVRDYPHSQYPFMCGGSGYVLGSDIARDIFTVSANVPFFYIEDVYVSLCMQQLSYPTYNILGFHMKHAKDHCFYKRSNIAISYHTDNNPDIIKRIWKCKTKVHERYDNVIRNV